MNSVLERVYEIGIIPVIAFNSVDEAIPLCKALMDGGLPAAEVTFRTACAEECIKKIHEELPNMLLGAGTVLTVDQADRAMAAGASFIVAPGFDPEVCKHVIDKGGIMMPGTATSGEMQQAMNMGCEVVKFFPAEANGGVDKLKNIGAALKTCKWMCTGGVNAKNVNNYLGYNQIIAVGGTWMCKSDKIKAGAWDEIAAMSREAVDVMLGLELAHLLVDLVVFFNELLLDEHDVLFLKQRLDIGEAHVEIPHVPDDIEPRGLADIVVAVIRFLVPVARLQKSHPVVESERGDRNAVRLRHFADRQQMRAFFVVHFRPSVWQKTLILL